MLFAKRGKAAAQPPRAEGPGDAGAALRLPRRAAPRRGAARLRRRSRALQKPEKEKPRRKPGRAEITGRCRN